jgi:TetR/AcrR family transcriptional regulator, transcriptional repressor for nem operon
MKTTQPRSPGETALPSRGPSTKEQVLSHAASLIREKGFRSTSIADVLERAGIQKGSFYYYFPSKEDLGHAVLDRWIAEFQRDVVDGLSAQQGPPPLVRITSCLDMFVEETEANGCRGGCVFGNLAIELADVHEGFRLRLAESFRGLAGTFASLLERAKKAGELRPDTDCATLGTFITACIEGGMLLAKVHKSTEPLEATLRTAKAHLASHSA